VNVLVTFAVSGLWHGAHWNFVLWGVLNGIGTLPAVLRSGQARRGPGDIPGGEPLVPRPATVLRIMATFAFACLTWVFFRAVTFDDALTILGRFVTPGCWTWPFRDFANLIFVQEPHIAWTLCWLAVLVVAEWLQRRHAHPLSLNHWPRPGRWLVYTALIGVILYFGTRNQGQFIYFQF
jgi:D-alanyl-lipoteichoic acid acyltransferase DltB (MBOAT superfamily)